MVFSAASSNAETLSLSFVRDQFRSGYWTRGEIISHFIGTEGQDYFARVTNRLTPNLMLGLELNRAVIGSTVAGFTGPKERRVGGGIDRRQPCGPPHDRAVTVSVW